MPEPTGDLPIPYAGPYEERADGDRFRLCRVRASGTSAEMAPRNREPGRTPLRTPVSNSCGAKWRQRRRNEQATPIPSRKKTAGASRVTRVPVADIATGQVSRRCREQAKEIAAAPGAAARHGLEFMFEAQVFQGKAFPTEAKVRSGWHGDVPTFAGCSVDTDRRARSPRSVPFTDNRAGPRFPSPMRRGASGTPPVVRLQNGQQNAHRRDPSRGDPGGRFARQSRRGIRLRVRTP